MIRSAMRSADGCYDGPATRVRPAVMAIGVARFLVAAIVALCSAASVEIAEASGLAIELKDVAPDRVERQRAAALGALPLPGTPDLANRAERLAAKGLKAGDPVFIRIFKSESLLEVWMRKDNGAFILFETYPICHWSGTIGPKVVEGDKQNPEGFYTLTRQQLHLIGRWPRSLNLGFPNPYDKALGRTGSYILVHGGCTSVGCFAMTNAVIAEIFDLAERALKRGVQSHIHVHAFPFRMTEEAMSAHVASPWHRFWGNLKEGYDAFEQTRLPPRVGICDKRYSIQSVGPGEGADQGPLAVCGATVAALQEMARSRPLASATRTSVRLQSSPPRSRVLTNLPLPSSSNSLAVSAAQQTTPNPIGPLRAFDAASGPMTTIMTGRSALGGPVPANSGPLPCQIERASCRRWSALQNQSANRRAAAGKVAAAKRAKPAAR